MTQGPFGGSRFLDLLPFTSDEVEVTIEEDRNSSPRFFPEELRDLLNSLDYQPDSVVKVSRRVIVKQKPDAKLSIMKKIKEEISELGERTSSITYFMIDNKFGYISSTRTDERFRRRGLASELRRDAINDMKSIDIDVIYSFPASSEGKSLAESQGFTESDVEGYLSKKV